MCLHASVFSYNNIVFHHITLLLASYRSYKCVHVYIVSVVYVSVPIVVSLGIGSVLAEKSS